MKLPRFSRRKETSDPLTRGAFHSSRPTIRRQGARVRTSPKPNRRMAEGSWTALPSSREFRLHRQYRDQRRSHQNTHSCTGDSLGFAINAKTRSALASLKATTGTYLWTPGGGGAYGSVADTILGNRYTVWGATIILS